MWEGERERERGRKGEFYSVKSVILIVACDDEILKQIIILWYVCQEYKNIRLRCIIKEDILYYINIATTSRFTESIQGILYFIKKFHTMFSLFEAFIVDRE